MVKKHSMLCSKNDLIDWGAINIIIPIHAMLIPELMTTSKLEYILFIPEHGNHRMAL